MHDFNPLRDFLGPIILIVILLVGFGVMSGANAKALVSTFLDLVISLAKVMFIALAKLLPPLLNGLATLLKLVVHKTTEVLIQLLEHKKPDDPGQIPQNNTTTSAPTSSTEQTSETPGQTIKVPPAPEPNPVVSGLKKAHESTTPKKPNPNPFLDDPDIEIIEK